MHSHISKVLEWTLDEEARYKPKLYGCTGCDETFDTPPSNGRLREHLHTEYVEGCFACKAGTLQLSTGDANSGLIDNGYTKKSWKSELDLYKTARAQGIQPDSTKRKDIEKAINISNKTGHAYGSKL